MENKFPSNTDSAREKKAAVTKGAMTAESKGVKGVINRFLFKDVEDVKKYIIDDVLIPNTKQTIMNVVAMLLHCSPQIQGQRPVAGKVDFTQYSRNQASTNSNSCSVERRNNFDYENLIFPDSFSANAVLDTMCDCIDQYGVVSIGDMYDFADVSYDNYMYNDYGWRDLSGAFVSRSINGKFVIKLPKCRPVKN